MRERDVAGHVKTGTGPDLEASLAVLNRHGPLNPDHPARPALLAPSRGADRFTPGRGAAVEDRQFVRIDFGDDVIDAQRAQRSHQMLDRPDQNAVTPDRRGERLRLAEMPLGRHVDGTPILQAATEHDAVVGRRRADAHGRVSTGMQAASGALERNGQRGLQARGRRADRVAVQVLTYDVLVHRIRPRQRVRNLALRPDPR